MAQAAYYPRWYKQYRVCHLDRAGCIARHQPQLDSQEHYLYLDSVSVSFQRFSGHSHRTIGPPGSKKAARETTDGQKTIVLLRNPLSNMLVCSRNLTYTVII